MWGGGWGVSIKDKKEGKFVHEKNNPLDYNLQGGTVSSMEDVPVG